MVGYWKYMNTKKLCLLIIHDCRKCYVAGNDVQLQCRSIICCQHHHNNLKAPVADILSCSSAGINQFTFKAVVWMEIVLKQKTFSTTFSCYPEIIFVCCHGVDIKTVEHSDCECMKIIWVKKMHVYKLTSRLLINHSPCTWKHQNL